MDTATFSGRWMARDTVAIDTSAMRATSSIVADRELITIFSEDLVPCLVYPRPTEEIRAMTEPKIREDYPDLLAILDATNWHQLKPGNFLHNRLTYSAYKHDTVFQVLMGEWFNRLERVFG